MMRWPVSGSIHSRGSSLLFCARPTVALKDKKISTKRIGETNLRNIFTPSLNCGMRVEKQKAEGRKQKAERKQFLFLLPSAYCLLPTVLPNPHSLWIVFCLEENPDAELYVTRSARSALDCEERSEVRVVILPNAVELVLIQLGDIERERVRRCKALRQLHVEEVKRQTARIRTQRPSLASSIHVRAYLRKQRSTRCGCGQRLIVECSPSVI